MKICWDTLEKLRYSKDTGFLYKDRNKYIYKHSCKVCGEEFLARDHCPGLYCSNVCSTNDKVKLERKKLNPYINSPRGNKSYKWKGGVKKLNIPLYNTYAHQIDWCEKVRRDPEHNDWLQVKCAYCGKWYRPKVIAVRHRIEVLYKNREGESRLYCSNECKLLCPTYLKQKYSAEETGTKQLSREVQPELRQMIFKRDNYQCIKCKKTKGLQCHHKEGILWEPLQSADVDMCVTLCKDCHKKVHKIEGCSYYDMRCQ